LPEFILNSPEYSEGNYENAIRDAFIKTDLSLQTETGRHEIAEISNELPDWKNLSSSPTLKSKFKENLARGPDFIGCTANVILIKNSTIYSANAGDSRAILSCRSNSCICLTKDHKPDDICEAERISKAGGYISEGRVNGGLNLSRAIGDLSYKMNKSLKQEEQIISCEPDIKKIMITKDIDFILMGCDGIFELQLPEEIVEFISKENIKQTNMVDIVRNLLDSACSPDVVQSLGIGCDNMTCILIKFAL